MRNLAIEQQYKVEKALISTLKFALLGLSIVLLFATGKVINQKIVHNIPFEITQIIDKPYEVQLISSPGKSNSLAVVVSGKEIDEKDTQQIAQTIRKEKQRDATVYTYSNYEELDSLEHHPEELRYKAETTKKGTRVTCYYFYPEVVADKKMSQEWDLSENKLNLVTGLLTVKLSMDDQTSKEDILAQAKGLSELLILHNPKAKIQRVILEVTAGSNYYHYDSKEAQLLANVSYQA